MTTPQQPDPHIPGFGPAVGYGGAPTQPLSAQPAGSAQPTEPLPAQPSQPTQAAQATQPLPPGTPNGLRPYGGQSYLSQPYAAQPYTAQSYTGEPSSSQSYAGQAYASAPGEPDWSAMADHYEARGKRKRILAVAGGALAVCLVGGVTAYAWSTTSSSGGSATAGAAASPSASPTTPASVSAAPTVAPSSHPKAPPVLRPDQLFVASLKVGGKTYNRVVTDTRSVCWKATWGGLGNVLAADDCRQVLRATYTSGKVSVTVGVAALQDVRAAMKTAAQFHGSIAPLWHKGDMSFCKKTACALTHAVEDRFLYLTIAGPNSGAAGSKDSTSTAAGRAAATAVLGRLMTLH